ncbi:MAG: hypothetical protein ACTSRC_12585 [Candidatus Helarchaeota archaeon]
MREILGIWVIENDGQILFSQELYPQGATESNVTLFSGLIVTIQKFLSEIGDKDAERIDIGNEKIFISKDPEYGLIFIMKVTETANNRKITKLLSKIRKDFIKSFSPYFTKYSPSELQLYISNIFRLYLNKLFESSLKERMEEFFGTT